MSRDDLVQAAYRRGLEEAAHIADNHAKGGEGGETACAIANDIRALLEPAIGDCCDRPCRAGYPCEGCGEFPDR